MATNPADDHRSTASYDQRFDRAAEVALRNSGPTDVPESVPDDVRHSREDAISERQFEVLVQSTYTDLDEYYGLQTRFCLFVLGRMGLRSGELAHMERSWFDYESGRLHIPAHSECTSGRNGTVCGMCRQHAQQKAEIRSENRYAELHATLGPKDEYEPGGGDAVAAVVEADEMEESMWSAKTDSAARQIPYDALPRCELVITEFLNQYDGWPLSSQAINRRIDRVVEAAPVEIDNLYPHALRATCSSYWVGRTLGSNTLMYMMGWADQSTARKYIEDDPDRAAEEIYAVAP